MLRTLNAAAARRWADLALALLTAERDAIDRINVFPVADGDTGTNLLQTARSAVAALDESDCHTLGGVLRELARGALAGASGNSGMLLSQFLRGLADQVPEEAADADGALFRDALRGAEERARRAVAEPAPGTFLSVLGEAVAAAPESQRLDVVVRAVTRAAVKALAATREQLPALSAAGVVDAGGRGLVVVLDALHAVVCDGERVAPDAPAAGGGDPGEHRSRYEYEVMYLLADTDSERVGRLREALLGLGDCVSVVGDGAGAFAVHVHCDDIGAAIEAGIEAGRPHRIKVVRFVAQQEEVSRRTAVLACAPDAVLGDLFAAEGAEVLIGGAGLSADRIRDAVCATGAAHVIVLPNDAELARRAEQAAGQAVDAGHDVVVLPTASPVQGLAALAVHDPGRRRSDDQVAMAEAAAATRRGELCIADAEALTWVGRCRPGDVLGFVDGEVVLIHDDLAGAARELLDRMLATGGELVTALLHEQVPESLPEQLDEYLRRTHPEVELVCYPGGQLGARLMFGVE